MPKKTAPPVYTENTKDKQIILKHMNEIKESLRNLNLKNINKIYDDIEITNNSIIYEFVEICHGRKIVKVTHFNGEELDNAVYFYKSSGESRYGCNLKNIWFPMGIFESIKDYKNYNFDGEIIRLKKLEDDYLICCYSYFEPIIKNELSTKESILTLDTPRLLKYSRFINRKYAIFSKLLGDSIE